MKDLAIGIDLGTTNSLIAYWDEATNQSQLIPNALGEFLTPSVVSIDQNNHLLIGQPARSRMITHPKQTAAAFKRFLGSERFYQLGEHGDKDKYSPTELCSLILKSLKEDAEHFFNQAIKDVVISVPAYFSDQQRKQVSLAAELAGLNAVRLINEPTAAAMAYSLHEKHERCFLVFDLGGGTFDVTIVDYQDNIIEVRASAGDNRLGGEDFTNDLVDAVLSQLERDRLSVSLIELNLIYQSCEKAKCTKTQTLTVQLPEPFKQEILFDQAQLQGIWQSTLDRLTSPLRQALSDARINLENLDEVIFVGGSTRLSEVQQLATRLLGRFGHQSLNPDYVVALGAAVQAACRLRHAAVEELIMTDVCPFSLGIAVSSDNQHGMFSTIIERNTVVPTSRVERYYARDNKTRDTVIAIYQGERFWVKDNIFIDTVEVKLPENRSDDEAVDVRFSYDINGLLDVDVTILSTGEVIQKVIDRTPRGVTEEEKQQSKARLARLKTHPRDELPNVTLNEHLQQLFEEKLGDQRRSIQELIMHFEQALQTQNKQIIKAAKTEIEAQLKSLQ